MSSYRPSLIRFRRYLDQRQRDAEADFDPLTYRRWLASIRVGVGYVPASLATNYGANLRQIIPRAVPMGDPRWGECEAYLGLGMLYDSVAGSHPGMERIFSSAPRERPVALFEQGFIASVASWTSSFETGRRDYSCLGYVIDDIAHYYMAEFPNRLIRQLNGQEELTDEQRERARANMRRMCEERISKYNHQPVVELSPTDRRRVLVCDQTYADASTIYGLADDAAFEQMLADAIRENPDAEILVKTHPDTVDTARKEKTRQRRGFYTGMSDHDNVRVITDAMNPMALMEQVDKVYVGTSGMGMEALIAGKEVVCYGAPFFAGWGVTDDRREVPHRHRERTVEDLFYYFYIWYTHYATPDVSGPAEIEDALDYIVENRGRTGPPRLSTRASEHPKVSVVIPMHSVERFIKECVRSVLDQTLRDIEVIVVDDQSPDGSRAIVERLAAEDPRLRCIEMPQNVGQGFARNAGIDAARGEYVWFIDSDDIMGAPDALARLVADADIDAADMVRARKHIQDERGLRVRHAVDFAERYFPGQTHGLDLKSDPELLRNNHFWNFLYRREFLDANGIRFELTQFEEWPFYVHALLEARVVSCCDVVGTTYRVRAGSTMRREKTAADIERRMRNIAISLAHLRRHGAHERASLLRPSYEFCVSRSVAQMFSGFQLEFLLALPTFEERVELYESMRTVFVEAGLGPDDLIVDPDPIDDALYERGHYHLLLACCLGEDYRLLDGILHGTPMGQAEVYDHLVRHKSDPVGQAFSIYIRDHEPEASAGRAARTSMASRPRLVLHIGSTKTGSTYLQHFCDLNRGALLEQGILYPEFGIFRQPGRPHKTAGHADFVRDARSRNGAPLLKRLFAAVDAAPRRVHTVVLSSEAFFLARDPEVMVGHFAPHFDVQVLVYLRRPDDWANSQYAEYVGGGAMSRVVDAPERWLSTQRTRQRLDYASLLDAWATAAGDGALIVRPYEKSQWVDGSLLADFRVQVGVPEGLDLAVPPPDRANDMPLDAGHLRLLRRMNTMPFPDTEHYLAFIEEVWRVVRERGGAGGSQEYIGPELRARILDDTSDALRLVAERFLGREDGVFFEDMSPREVVLDEDASLSVLEVEAIFDAYIQVGNPGIMASLGAQDASRPGSKIGRKLRKLRRDPQRFMADSQIPALRWAGRWWRR